MPFASALSTRLRPVRKVGFLLHCANAALPGEPQFASVNIFIGQVYL